MLNANIMKAQRIANKCREVKGWKPGAKIHARSTKDTSVGDLYVYSVIGDSWFEEGVTAKSVQAALDDLKGVKTLNIFINSEGGDVFEAKAIYSQLKRFAANAELIVHIDGMAASAATFIAMAGDKIITSPAATWMVHEAWTFAMGDAKALRDSADLLDMMNADIADIYAARTKRPVEEMRALMAKTTWMNATQALEEKFTDEIATYEDDEEDEADGKAVDSKMLKNIARANDTTQKRIAASISDLMAFRAKRAVEITKASNEPKKDEEKPRTSATVKHLQRPASR